MSRALSSTGAAHGGMVGLVIRGGVHPEMSSRNKPTTANRDAPRLNGWAGVMAEIRGPEEAGGGASPRWRRPVHRIRGPAGELRVVSDSCLCVNVYTCIPRYRGEREGTRCVATTPT